MANPVRLELSAEAALVLFELLSRFSETDADALTLVDQAERRVLWNVLGLLEKVLVEPFLPDYGQRLAVARDRLRGAVELASDTGEP